MTFEEKVKRVTEIVDQRGVFDTTPENAVRAVLEASGRLDAVAGKIATDSEVADLATVNQANESGNRSVVVHLSDALHFIQDIKLMSSAEPDLSQGFRDMLWRAADVVQQEIECALSHASQDELDAWKDRRS
jgi:hypothetical protein